MNKDLIINAGKFVDSRGWVPATSGNISCRFAEDRFAITASGKDKGNLTSSDILLANINEPPPLGSSAETLLHLHLYKRDPNIGAVIHTHSRASVLMSRLAARAGEIVFFGWELQKAFAGITDHLSYVRVPVFHNSQDMLMLATKITACMDTYPERHSVLGDIYAPGYLLAGHGVYVWGKDMNEALRHLVAMETLLDYELTLKGIN